MLSKNTKIWLFILIIFSVLDVLTTFYASNLGLIEINSFAVSFTKNIPILFLMKLFVISISITGALIGEIHFPEYIHAIISGTAIFTIIFVLNNILQIFNII